MSTHRTRLARALAAALDLGYQSALARVVAAAQADRLPALLDELGMRQALDLLIADAHAVPDDACPFALSTSLAHPGYRRLVQVTGTPLTAAVARRVERARAAGVTPAVCHRPGEPDVWQAADADAAENPHDEQWHQLTAEPRDEYSMPDPYPPDATPDGYLPLDRALQRRDATGDIDAYEQSLRGIVRSEIFDIDGWAHLGSLYLAMAAPTGTEVVFTPQPTAAQRRAWSRAALSFYHTAVAIGELALPNPFDARLPWSRLDNRPFLRALHGMASVAWQLDRFDAARATLTNMLWLNPHDHQGARFVLPDVQAHRPFTHGPGR